MNWTSDFAYAISLFTADGCLSPDRRHLEFCSKDKDQVENFVKCLGLTNRITKKARGREKIKKYYRVQFGNVRFYNFLCSIGLAPCKSLILERIVIPSNLFSDFLRGFFDGDGNFNVFKYPESQYPQIRVRFYSASPKFIIWLHKEIGKRLDVSGFISKGNRVETLEYAISDSKKILNYIYYSPNVICLSRKFEQVKSYITRM